MTYQEAISMFKLRYERNADKALSTMTDDEILMEISAVQAEIQNAHMISQLEDTVTLVRGQDKYTAGNGASNIPTDILQIIDDGVTINDGLNTVLVPFGRSYNVDHVKTTCVPYAYALYKQGGDMVMELDSFPDQAYVLTMFYNPAYPIYAGSGGVNQGIWADVDYTAIGYGGSLKLPVSWHPVVVAGAVANVSGDIKRYEMYLKMRKDLLSSRPIHASGEIPYDNGVEKGTSFRQVLPDGYDRQTRRRY